MENKQYRCKSCGKSFASENELHQHEKNCKPQPSQQPTR